MKLRNSLAVLCLLVVALLLPSGYVGAAHGETNFIDSLWSKKLDGIHDLLLQHEWKKAEKKARRLTEDMLDVIVSGPGGRQRLGMAMFLRAIALEGLGDHRLADWYWRLSAQLFPSMGTIDARRYLPNTTLGSATVETSPARRRLESLLQGEGPIDPKRMTAPEKIDGERPRFPYAKVGTSVSVQVEVVIGEDGQLYEPKIRDITGEYTLALSALDAMSSWRFKPSTLDGRPVPSIYVLTVDYISR